VNNVSDMIWKLDYTLTEIFDISKRRITSPNGSTKIFTRLNHRTYDHQ